MSRSKFSNHNTAVSDTDLISSYPPLRALREHVFKMRSIVWFSNPQSHSESFLRPILRASSRFISDQFENSLWVKTTNGLWLGTSIVLF